MEIAPLATGGVLTAAGGGAVGYGVMQVVPALREAASLESLDLGIKLADEIDDSQPVIQRSLQNIEDVTARLGDNPGVRDLIAAFRLFNGDAHSDLAAAVQKFTGNTGPLRDALVADRLCVRKLQQAAVKGGGIAMAGAAVSLLGASLLLNTAFNRS